MKEFQLISFLGGAYVMTLLMGLLIYSMLFNETTDFKELRNRVAVMTVTIMLVLFTLMTIFKS